MSSQTDRTHLELWERSVTEETLEASGNSELEINVVFTDSEGTLAALKKPRESGLPSRPFQSSLHAPRSRRSITICPK